MTSPDTRLPAARTRSFLKTAGIACALALPMQAAVTFSDSSFADFGGNYAVTQFITGNGGTQTTSYQSSGGNPGEYLSISNSVNAAPNGSSQSITNIFMIRNGASYTPSVSGAITSVDFSISLVKLAGSSGLIVNASPGIIQGG